MKEKVATFLESDMCLRLESARHARLNLPSGTFPLVATALRGHFSRLHRIDGM